MEGGGRRLVLRGKGKRTAPGSSRVKGGTHCTAPWREDPQKVTAQLVSRCHLAVTLRSDNSHHPSS